MPGRTERTILLTEFDAICVDRENNTGVRAHIIIAGYYKTQDDLITVLKEKSLLNPRLEVHRAVNIRYRAEYRSMTDDFFLRHATLKDYYFQDERN